MTVVAATFGALSEVQMMHAIYHFKAQEVNNPMLQTVCNSKLKRRSCSHYKPITQSWRKHFAKCCEITLLLRSDFAAFLNNVMFLLLTMPDLCREKEAGNLKSHLRSPVKIAWCCEMISQPSWVSVKSCRHHFLLRNGAWSLPIFATDIGRYFPLDFCCLNPKILLVNHQLHDSLAFKLVKRLNIYVIISFILCSYIYLSGACSQRGVPSVKVWVSK